MFLSAFFKKESSLSSIMRLELIFIFLILGILILAISSLVITKSLISVFQFSSYPIFSSINVILFFNLEGDGD